jgi:hypothetical protein
VGTTESDARQLFKIIWLDGVSRGDYAVPTNLEAANASNARCFAAGPHRDLNISNWCCKDGTNPDKTRDSDRVERERRH